MRSLVLSVAVAASVPLYPAFGGNNRAVLVGSNQAGPGQSPLQWAGADAERMRDVLTEIGGFLPEEVEVLRDPDVDTLLSAIDRARADLAGTEGTRFVFYYSGHARARSLSLGPDELPIEVLDAWLQAVPASQRLAVLDACQAGEPSSPKGIVPEAAFSFVSVAGLSTVGTAVVASSTATELSQESERLSASTFTHHWVSALRGAADADNDGMVTLDEAYGYAYDRTVLDTAATAIGPQHPTIRLDMRGHGDWVLTRPSAATGQLLLPVSLEGAVTVKHSDSGNVVAEVAKLPSEDVALAVVPGEYEVLVRVDSDACSRNVRITAGEVVEVAVSDCAVAAVEENTPKASTGSSDPDFDHQVAIYARGGMSWYQPFPFVTGGGELSVHLLPYLALVGGVEAYAVKRVLPPEIQLETGVFSVWNVLKPVNVGVVYTPMRGFLQPYAGVDMITTLYLRDERGSAYAWGARARGGVDFMLLEHLGANVNAALGAWQGRDWNLVDRRASPQGPLLQGSAGIFLAL